MDTFAPSQERAQPVEDLPGGGQTPFPQFAGKDPIVGRTIALGDLAVRIVFARCPIDAGYARHQPDELLGSLIGVLISRITGVRCMIVRNRDPEDAPMLVLTNPGWTTAAHRPSA